MLVAAHLWPALIPREIERMRVCDWLVFARSVDEWLAEQDRQRRRGGGD